jgi:predicted nucleic acid-binding protein
MLRVVVDTNKIIAVLLREGRVRRLLFHPGLEILLPEYVLDEIEEHREEITRRVPREALDLLLAKLSRRARVVRVKDVDKETTEHARRIAEEFDPDDYPFIAVSIEYNAPIWTNDKELIRHGLTCGEYLAIDTWAIEKLLEGRSMAKLLQELRRKYAQSQ